MTVPLALRATNPVRAVLPGQPAPLPVVRVPAASPPTSRPLRSGWRKDRSLHVAHSSPKTSSDTVDVDAIVKDLQVKWDNVENKTGVLVYAGGAVVLLWLSSSIVSAVNAVPLLPKLLELVGLGYTAWFVYRYLLFKSSREELIQDIDELKKKISGVAEETAGKAKSSSSSF